MVLYQRKEENNLCSCHPCFYSRDTEIQGWQLHRLFSSFLWYRTTVYLGKHSSWWGFVLGEDDKSILGINLYWSKVILFLPASEWFSVKRLTSFIRMARNILSKSIISQVINKIKNFLPLTLLWQTIRRNWYRTIPAFCIPMEV